MYFDLDRAKNAGERFRQLRSTSRLATLTESFADGGEAAAPTGTAKKRLSRLNRSAALQAARLLSLSAERSSAPDTQADVVDSLSMERVIGSSDLKDIDYLEMAIAVARAVGRVKIPNGFGTGFLVGPSLMMTNCHVIPDVETARRSSIQMDYQDDVTGTPMVPQSFAVRPDLFFVTDKHLDFTLVGVAENSESGRAVASYPWLKLIAETGKLAVGDCINIVQHPLGGMKQIAFRKNEVVQIPGGKPEFLYYSTDTDRGSSGAPAFNDQWELVALHHSGVPDMDDEGRMLKSDGTPFRQGTDDPATIKWLANEGVRVSGLVGLMRGLRLGAPQDERLAAVLSLSAPNPVELARRSAVPGGADGTTPKQPQTEEAKMANTITISIPMRPARVRLDIQIGGDEVVTAVTNVSASPAGGGGVPPPPTTKSEGDEEKVVVDQDYSDRKGYDPKFLGFQVPLPRLSKAMEADTAIVNPDVQRKGDRFELAYYNYSVYLNKRRRTAWFSAANVDGSQDQRPDIGKRSGDRWYADTRVSADAQLTQPAFEHGIDRGHLTRREDTAWGPDAATALKSNNDTFHFANCSLQASAFNQGKDRWQGLEQFLLEKHARKDQQRMVVITGPIFSTKDPAYRNEKMKYTVRCPLQFWKVCVLKREDGTPSATGFILGQEEIAGLPGFEEAFDVAAAQVTITELEKRTGLDFGAIKTHDHFAAAGSPSLESFEVAVPSGKFRCKPIRDGQDIVV